MTCERSAFRPPHDVELGICVLWLKMSRDSDKACGLRSPDSRTSCVFQAADESDEIPGLEEDSVLEMLSYSKFSDLEAWLCMPATLLPRALKSSHSSPSHLTPCPLTGRTDPPSSPLEEAIFLTPSLGQKTLSVAKPLAPIVTSAPCDPIPITATMTSVISTGDSASQGGVCVRKRRRLAASPGGLRWNSSGLVQRDFDRTESSPVSSARASAWGRSLPMGNTAAGGGGNSTEF
ncbi:hypothetical protein UPYG_G00330230 [Umbra pygmaea]|uniref:Uncharacterized protein n=1 Tax=Umbra pygmaea TaxID=75934 RepID=A0ABD0WQI8_UMBPY